jgi:hypothetical protein
MAAVALLMCAAGARAQVSDTQIPLNYNFHGYARSTEIVTAVNLGNADVINFRSISPLVGVGLYFDSSDASAWGTNAITGTTGITYRLFNDLGYGATTAANPTTYGLDSVHLGTRVFYGGMETMANSSTNLGNATGWAPIFNVTALSTDGSSTISGTTDVAHGLVAGQRVDIAGANPVAFSGAFTVATASGTNFTLTPVVGAAPPPSTTATGSIFCNSMSAPQITQLSASGTNVTATTNWSATNNGPSFTTSLLVNITGSSDPWYNGLYSVNTSNTNPFHYTDTTPGAPTTNPVTTGTQIYLATCDHTGAQTTTLASPVYLDANAQIGILATVSDGGEFEVVLNFTDNTSQSAWIALSPMTQGANPPIISDKVSAVSLIGGTNVFHSVNAGDTALLPATAVNSQVGENIISVPKFTAAGINIVGKRLSSITFRNPVFAPVQISALSVSGGFANATVVQLPGYVPGMPIHIGGVLSTNAGNVREFDGDYTVDSPTATGFRFKTSATGTASAKMFATVGANAVQVSGITTSGAVPTATATATTAAPHGFAVGDTVTIEGHNAAGVNGTYTIFTVPSTTTFTYTPRQASSGSGTANMQATRIGFGRGYQIHAVSIRSEPRCGSADFNCDGDIGTDTDIETFFACLAGNCPAPPCNSTADFNGDGDIGTDADIEAFFRVLAGGTC